MKILVTNDDGIHHPGICTLREELAQAHDVTVVAPDRERSAVGHGITLHVPLRVFSVDHGKTQAFAVTGTPADCVKLGLLELVVPKPDLVVSGINPGPNVGVNLNYSGTVSAAREAAILGYRAVAISVSDPDATVFLAAARFMSQLIGRLDSLEIPKNTFLNVNVPARPSKEIKGVKVCRQGLARLEEAFYRRTDPRNLVYYWQGSQTQFYGESEDEDGVALAAGYITITPVRCDMTEYSLLDRMKGWNL
ncbi:MAG: 5'/3'-nucleotidase SurE [Desulfatibacillaceae bacterium]|nr:5'/3'-nucleotidase SurE [Desulfatibacillaceae bacterium]